MNEMRGNQDSTGPWDWSRWSSWFEGSHAYVTGAASGMGRAIAVAFAGAGARVTLVDIDVEGGESTRQMIERDGGQALFIATDVSDPDAVEASVATGVEAFGALSSAVNAAAIENEVDYLADLPVNDFDRIMAVNARSVFLCMRSQIRRMLESGGGAIVNIASTNSFRPQPHQSAYTASKFAVLGLTRSAAVDYAPRGIRINAICPGAIDTPMLRGAIEARGRDPIEVAERLSLVGRFGAAEEIAAAALWLCSDAAGFTIGHPLAVDGGYLAR
jgi:NAD(P)-dependent dehydrogenase (short-subunit alcohol dehydrogenase family)